MVQTRNQPRLRGWTKPFFQKRILGTLQQPLSASTSSTEGPRISIPAGGLCKGLSLLGVQTDTTSIVTIRRWRLLGASTAALASLYHLSLAGYLYTAPDFTKMTYGQDAVLAVPGFFLVLGAFQIVWSWETLKETHEIIIGIGTMGFLGSIVLYLVALATPLPAGISQQTIAPVALVAKIIEIVYVVSSVAVARRLSAERLGLRKSA